MTAALGLVTNTEITTSQLNLNVRSRRSANNMTVVVEINWNARLFLWSVGGRLFLSLSVGGCCFTPTFEKRGVGRVLYPVSVR